AGRDPRPSPRLPPELTCTWTCTAADGASCGADSGSGDISESVDLPSASSVTYLAVCDIDPAAAGTLTNTATIASAAGDPDTANNSATDVDTLEPNADLEVLAIAAPDSVEIGELVTLEITVTNAGPSDATGVVLTTVLPAALQLDSTLGCAEDPAGVPTCSLGALAAGESALVAITGLAIAEGSSQGSVEVSSDLADPDPSNDVALPVVTVGSLVDIPTLDFAGLAGLVLLLAAAGWVSLRRRGSEKR
ncbi:MAG: DUF11 domain-containing protein, partial [Acidobacteriota bacterium]